MKKKLDFKHSIMKPNPIQNTVNPISAIFNLDDQIIMEQFFFFNQWEEKINKNIIAENGSMECFITIHRFLLACETKNQYGYHETNDKQKKKKKMDK